MRRLVLGAAIIAASLTLGHPAHAEPLPIKSCVVFEDDSYICGSMLVTLDLTTGDDDTWELDTTQPYVTGCVPGGICEE